jgi:hypothetical protein
MSDYQFSLSFLVRNSTDPTPPEVVFPPNVTPLVPPVGSIIEITKTDGNLLQGQVTGHGYKIVANLTIVIIFIDPHEGS